MSDHNGEIKVDSGVPMPEARGNRPIYPWEGMAVGDSFFAPGKTAGQLSAAKVSRMVKCPGEKYTTRTMIENGVKGVRVWRIA